jgi:plasmid maintenance system antidote protein VapI
MKFYTLLCIVVDINHAIKVGKILNNSYMETKFMTAPSLPPFLPHGWKKEVAKVLGIHPNTVTRNLKLGKGDVYNRIVLAAAAKYGKKKEITHES